MERSRTVGATGVTTEETSYYLASACAESHSAEQWAGLARNHRGIENRNHWRRDACLMEDKARSKNASIVAAFAIMRCASLLTNAETEDGNINAFTQKVAANKNLAFKLVMR